MTTSVNKTQQYSADLLDTAHKTQRPLEISVAVQDKSGWTILTATVVKNPSTNATLVDGENTTVDILKMSELFAKHSLKWKFLERAVIEWPIWSISKTAPSEVELKFNAMENGVLFAMTAGMIKMQQSSVNLLDTVM